LVRKSITLRSGYRMAGEGDHGHGAFETDLWRLRGPVLVSFTRIIVIICQNRDTRGQLHMVCSCRLEPAAETDFWA